MESVAKLSGINLVHHRTPRSTVASTTNFMIPAWLAGFNHYLRNFEFRGSRSMSCGGKGNQIEVETTILLSNTTDLPTTHVSMVTAWRHHSHSPVTKWKHQFNMELADYYYKIPAHVDFFLGGRSSGR